MGNFHTATVRTARKAHRCFHCGGEIAKGEKYVRNAGVFYGDFYNSASHEVCDQFATETYDGEGISEGDLVEIAHCYAELGDSESKRDFVARAYEAWKGERAARRTK